jgi:phospholipase C
MTKVVPIDTSSNFNWYDLVVKLSSAKPFRRRGAGRVETGQWTYSDPMMGMARGHI